MKIYAVIGLGYVGLGLALSLSKINTVFGYDIDEERINQLRHKFDRNNQVADNKLLASRIILSSNSDDIKSANFYIVTVSTPAYFYEIPNLEPLIDATKKLASVIKKDDVIVFESTVYPGTTTDICIPILEQYSHLRCGIDFHVGYSPERINPGDQEHTLQKMTKIISSQNKDTLEVIRETYQQICDTVYPVSSIQTAEAIKLLENIQRDVNIALMNEFTKIMHALNLNTHEIIEGAKTKWGFVPYKPGFVGGHCISIDPHYLVFEAKRHGVMPELIPIARRVNDGMTQFIIQSMMKLFIKNRVDTTNATIGIFGITYKENVLDTRNSLALKLVKELREYGFSCRVHDPLCATQSSIYLEENLEDFDSISDLSVAIIVVGDDFYKAKLEQIIGKCKDPKLVMDIPNLYIDSHQLHKNLVYWSL